MTEASEPDGLTHIDELGRARMVDVSEKPSTDREARAAGTVTMKPETLRLIRENGVAKGDVLAVARIAGILAAKRTDQLVPLCHGIPLSGVDLHFETRDDPARVEISATVRTVARTGVEMEALTAVSVAALTIYDMCKSVDRAMVIGSVRLQHKSGGKSGRFDAE